MSVKKNCQNLIIKISLSFRSSNNYIMKINKMISNQ